MQEHYRMFVKTLSIQKIDAMLKETRPTSVTENTVDHQNIIKSVSSLLCIGELSANLYVQGNSCYGCVHFLRQPHSTALLGISAVPINTD